MKVLWISRAFVVASLMAGTAGLGGCRQAELESIDQHQGSTLPVPDMTKVDFTYSASLAMPEVVVTGASGAVLANADVHAENTSTGSNASVTAGGEGGFILNLPNSEPGDSIDLHITSGEETSDTVALDSSLDGTPPPAPNDVLAQVNLDVSGTARVSGGFLIDGPNLQVVIIDETLGSHDTTETAVEATHLIFNQLITGNLEDSVVVYAIRHEAPGAPGPFVRVHITNP